jgi:hypothetical protein
VYKNGQKIYKKWFLLRNTFKMRSFMLLMLVALVAAEITKEERDKQCESAGGWMASAMLLSGLVAPILPEVTAFVWLTAAAVGSTGCK